MKTKIFFLITLLSFSLGSLFSQTLTQTIKGKVVDKATQVSLPGASVIIESTNPIIGNSTNNDGFFRLENVPVGRYSITVSYIGYSTVTIPEVLVGSGKEVVLSIELTESVSTLNEVIVKSQKDKPLNSMAAISARSFNVEETRRYAGGLDDPARLASAFSGVSMGGNMQDNAIVIRGNSPKGVLWRIEGADISNPNHFSGGNVAGGGFVSTISSQVLANSDFYTGAFPAEYGNALAGVFDIKLRTGNNEKREYSFQAGMMGIDVAAEGPFVKGKTSSFLFNYRYSTFGLMANLGMMPTDQTPIYQDLTFKLNFPTAKSGTFSIWGIGGIDNLSDIQEKDSLLWKTEWDRFACSWDEKFGALGVNHKYTIGKKSLVSSSVVLTGNLKQLDQQRLDNEMILRDDMDLMSKNNKVSFNSFINHKFNSKHSNRTGVKFNTLFYNLDLNGTVNEMPGTFANFVNENGSSYHMQAYTQSKFDVSDVFTLNAGVQAEYFDVNQKVTVQPRFGLNWDFSRNQSLSFGYGKHSQIEDLNIYFITTNVNGEMNQPNKNLKAAQAHHFVLGYNLKINESMRLKVEPYFQYLYDVPGIADSSFSMINFKQDLTFRQSLVNNSIGKNAGIDITLERFLKNNFYYMVTASVFDSKYKSGDGKWRNTRYNKGFVGNVLVGKEFFTGRDHKNVLGLNARLNIMGGNRYSPLLEQESLEVKRPVFDESKAFFMQDDVMSILNLTITYRVNHKHYAGIWALQLNNVLGVPQYGEYEYDYTQQKMIREKAVYRMPVISYKIEF